jgi:hemolysin activation/secretion protein
VHAVDVPSTAQPSLILRELDQKPRLPEPTEQIIKFNDEQPTAKNVSGAKVFKLQAVHLKAGTIYSQAQINKIAAPYLGKDVSFADLNQIAALITRQYRADGYMFSRAIVPPQEIQHGTVELQAVEGRLTDVEIVGNYTDRNGLIRKMADKLKSDRPMNSKDLERYLLLIDDLPGIKARGIIKPSTTPGGGKLIITIEETKAEGSLGLDNRGSKYLGQTRATGVAAFNSLLGLHDRTTLREILTPTSKELRFFDISHEEQVGTEGTRLKARYALTGTEPGADLKPLDVQGFSQQLDLDVLHPLIRSRQYNVNLIGGFTELNSKSKIANSTISNDRLRYLRAGTRFDFTDALAGVTQVELTGAKGLKIFDATDDGIGRSRANGEHDFFRANLSAVRLQDLPGAFSLQLSASGQYSPDALLASEEFTLGGGDYGRAYDAGEITGDQGVAGAIELRYGGETTRKGNWLESYQFYGYYDAGKVWNRNPAVSEASNASLTSAGGGVRFNLTQDISGYIELDKPLTRKVSAEGDKDPRVFASLTKRF